MKQKLICIVVSLICLILLTGNLVASPKLANDSTDEAKRNFRSFESLKVDLSKLSEKIKLESEHLNQNCLIARDNCDNAYSHLQSVGQQISSGCSTAGWGSSYCGDLIQWGFDTMDWVNYICANY